MRFFAREQRSGARSDQDPENAELPTAGGELPKSQGDVAGSNLVRCPTLPEVPDAQ